MGLDVNQEALALERAMGSVDMTTTDKLHGKIGTDTELADRSLFDILTGDGPASYPAAAAPANDVSLAEVLRAVYNNVSGVDGATNVLGVDDSDNGFASTNVAANRDGSILERNEFVIQAIEKAAVSSASPLTNGATVFTIANGPIAIQALLCYCTSNENSGGAATTVQWSHDPTDGAATTFSGASGSVASAVAGTTVVLQGTALSTAPTVTINGAVLGQTREIILMPGTITTTVANGPTTANFQHYIRYRPLAATSSVS